MSVFEAAADARAVLGDLELAVLEAESAGTDPEETIVLLHELKSVTARLYKEYEKKFIAQVESTPVPLAAHGAEVEIKRGTGRKGWEHQRLMEEAISRVLDRATDFDTGEVVWNSERCMRELVKLFSPSWRIKALGGIGLDADQYSVKGADIENVSIRRL